MYVEAQFLCTNNDLDVSCNVDVNEACNPSPLSLRAAAMELRLSGPATVRGASLSLQFMQLFKRQAVLGCDEESILFDSLKQRNI